MTQPPNTAVARIIRLLDKNKAKAAFLAPIALAVLAAIVNWAITGVFDAAEIKLAIEGVVAGIVSGGVVHQVPAKTAEVERAGVVAPSRIT